MEEVIIEQQNELYFDRYKDNETIFKRFKGGSDIYLNKIYNSNINENKPNSSKFELVIALICFFFFINAAKIFILKIILF